MMCVVEQAGLESSTLRYFALRFANCARKNRDERKHSKLGKRACHGEART